MCQERSQSRSQNKSQGFKFIQRTFLDPTSSYGSSRVSIRQHLPGTKSLFFPHCLFLPVASCVFQFFSDQHDSGFFPCFSFNSSLIGKRLLSTTFPQKTSRISTFFMTKLIETMCCGEQNYSCKTFGL